MSNDPYTPPSAPVRDRQPEAPGSTWKAVTFGVLSDIVGTFLAGIVLFALLGSMLVSAISDRLTDKMKPAEEKPPSRRSQKAS